MTRRVVVVLTWLLAAHAVLFGLYLGLLQVPESSAWMLALSALIAMAIVVGALVVHASALVLVDNTVPFAPSVSAGVRRFIRLVPALLVFAAALWIGVQLTAWHVANRGPIDAEVMTRFNRADTGTLHRAIEWAIFAARFVLGGSLALALAASGVQRRFKGAGRAALRAFHPATLAIVLGAEICFFVLPWKAAYWRPQSLPPTAAETVFVTVKLAAVAVAFAIGWMVLLWAGTRAASGPRDTT